MHSNMFEAVVRFLVLGYFPGTNVRVDFRGSLLVVIALLSMWLIAALNRVRSAQETKPMIDLSLITV